MNKNREDKIQRLVRNIWNILNESRGFTVANNYYVILYLLILLKEKIPFTVAKASLNHIKIDISKVDVLDLIYIGEIGNLNKIINKDIRYWDNKNFRLVVELIRKLDLNLTDKEFSIFFDEVLYLIATYLGKQGGMNLLPKEVSELVSKLVKLPEGANVYNPFAGLASFGVFFNNDVNYFGQELEQKTWALGILRLFAYNRINTSNFVCEDSIEKWNPLNKKYDLVIANPPFGVSYGSSYSYDDEYFRTYEQFFVKRGIQALNEKGKLIAIVSKGILFRKGSEKKLRINLVENDLIESVISFPKGLLINTSNSFVALVINKNKENKGHVNFINAENLFTREPKFSLRSSKTKTLDYKKLLALVEDNDESDYKRIINNSLIKNFDYNLNVSRYFIEQVDGIMLGDISEIISSKAGDISALVSRDKKSNTFSYVKNIAEVLAFMVFKDLMIPNYVAKNFLKNRGKVVNIKDLKNDIFNNKIDIKKVELSPVPKTHSIIFQSCLLLSTVGNNLKPTFFEFKDEPIFIGKNITAFKVDTSNVLLDYLVIELQKSYIKEQIKGYSEGSVLTVINNKDLLKIIIDIPDLYNQQQSVNHFKQSMIAKEQLRLKKNIEESGVDIADENSFLRHQIAGRLKNSRGAFKSIRKIIDEQVRMKVPDIDAFKLDKKFNSTFLDYLNILERDLDSINKSVNQTGAEIDLVDSKIENIDLIKFITNYVDEIKSRSSNIFDIELFINKTLLKENNIKTVIIKGDRELIRRMFDNIIENAEKHGFDNKISSKNRIDVDLLYLLEYDQVQVDFSNTGIPLPEDYDYESFTRKGSKSGKNGGNGIGGWFMLEVMKMHNGEFNFTDETGPESVGGDLATSIELTFPITIELKN